MAFEAIEANLRESFRALAAPRVSGDVRELGGVSIASLGVTFQMFNAAFLSAPVQSENELDRRVAQAAVFFQTRGMAWAFWVCLDYLERQPLRKLDDVVWRHGLRHVVDLPGMMAPQLAAPRRPLPVLRVQRVRGDAVCRDFCAIGSTCFNVPPGWFREVFEAEVWEKFAGYVGYVDDEPVASAATVIGAGVIGLYNVGTLPGHRRRGYGEAVVRYAVAEAQRTSGIETSILQSTPQGLELYKRMGYRSATRFTVFSV